MNEFDNIISIKSIHIYKSKINLLTTNQFTNYKSIYQLYKLIYQNLRINNIVGIDIASFFLRHDQYLKGGIITYP